MRVNDIPEFDKLSTPEKLLLAEDIWDSIYSDPASLPIPQSHKNELDKRLKSYNDNPGNILSLEELQGNIERRK